VIVPRHVDTLVLGAGPAGLAVGHALGSDFHIVEAQEGPGGLAASIEWQGAVFDLGGLCFRTPHPALARWLAELVPLETQRRQARCFFRGRMVHYPFQSFFADCGDAAIVNDCRRGLAARPAAPAPPADYHDYLETRLGRGLCEHFAFPYNRKLWGADLHDLAAGWAGERVAAVHAPAPAADVPVATRQPLAADSLVAYPAEGGFGTIFSVLARSIGHISYGVTARRISLRERRVRLSTGDAVGFRQLVSTLPLPVLARMVDELPRAHLEAAATLHALPLSLVLVATSAPTETEIQRVYSADPAVAAHKVALTFTSSRALRARPVKGIVAEVSHAEPGRLAGRDLEGWVVDDLRAMGVLPTAPDNDLHTRTVHLRHGYPVPTHGLPGRPLRRVGLHQFRRGDAARPRARSRAAHVRDPCTSGW
jgi:protoporphyrinogen oxidase